MRWAEPNVSNSDECHTNALNALRAGCQVVSSAHRIDCLRILARGISYYKLNLKFNESPFKGFRYRMNLSYIAIEGNIVQVYGKTSVTPGLTRLLSPMKVCRTISLCRPTTTADNEHQRPTHYSRC